MAKKESVKSDHLLNRTPPHDTDAEASLLSAIFINNDSLLDIIEILKPDDFYKGAHKKIFRAITELAGKEEPADLVTVANQLNEKDELEGVGGPAFLAAISDAAPVAVNAVHYARIVREKATLRELINTCSATIERCLQDKGNFKDILDESQASVLKIADRQSGSSFMPLSELINLNIDQLEELQGKEGGLAGLSTGYPRLDRITSGLQGSDLIILAARPSMGKTAFALNIARNVAFHYRKPVAVFSLEMSKEQLSMRLLTSEARVDANRLRSGVFSPEDWQNFTDAAGVLNEIPLFIDDTPSISVMDLRAKARKLFQKNKDIGLVIIDYLQLMKSSIHSDRRDLEIADISRALKSLAKELKVPVLALSQLNRALEQRSDKRPMMSDLRESGAIEQDADIISFIYRDEVYNKEPDNPKKGTAEIIVAKNRNGSVGTAHMVFNGQYTRFEELAPEAYQGFK